MKLPRRLLLFLLAGIFPAFASHAGFQDGPRSKEETPPKVGKAGQTVPDNITVIQDVEIGMGGGRPLHADVAFPKNPPVTPMPAVIWVHGGGWNKGTHKKYPAEWLASNGYFAASIEYRLSGEAKWPAQIEDCKLGVRWLRANAERYHVNPDRIAVWGGSAGGHLVSCLGTMDDPKFEGKGGYENVSSHVAAVVDLCGPVDFTAGSAGIQKPLAKPPDYEAPGLLKLFGGSFKEKPEVWKEGSPIQYVKAGLPPFFIMHGDKDPLVPHEQSEKLAAALAQAGVPVEFITVKNGGHGMKSADGDPPVEPDFNGQRAAILKFLDKHLK